MFLLALLFCLFVYFCTQFSDHLLLFFIFPSSLKAHQINGSSIKCGLTLFRMGIFGAAHGWEGGKRPPTLKSVTHIYNEETWHSCTYLKEIKKYMKHVTYPRLLLSSAFFHRKSANFIISRNTDIDCNLIHNF